MKKMKKLSWLLLATLMFAFTGCSNADDDPQENGGGATPPTEKAGTGTETDPYNVTAAIAQNNSGAEAWVKGYIVGQIAGKSVEQAEFDPPFHGATDDKTGMEATAGTNLLIAADAKETNIGKCIIVQLPVGEIRTALELVAAANQGNKGKELIIKGKLEKYYGAIGLKSCTTALFNGKTIGEGGAVVPPTPTEPLKDCFEEFSTISEKYKDANQWVPTWACEKAAGDRNWQGYIYNKEKFLQASAHDSKDANKGTHYESWVITPPLNVKEASKKVFSFRSCGGYWQETSSLKVYVLSEAKSTAAVKKELAVTIATTGDYVWVESGDIDLSKEGDIVYIGFCYTAEGGKSNSTSYRIDDFAFGRNQVDHTPDSDPTTPPATGDIDETTAISVAAALTATDLSVITVKGYMVGCLKYGAKPSYDNIAAAAADLEWKAPFTGTSTVMIADNATETDPTKCLLVKLNDQIKDFPGATGLRSAVQLDKNPNNAGKVLAVKGKKKAMFTAFPGIREIEGWKLVK